MGAVETETEYAELGRQADSDLPAPKRLEACIRAAVAAEKLGLTQDAADWAARALALAEDTGDHAGRVNALSELGVQARKRGQSATGRGIAARGAGRRRDALRQAAARPLPRQPRRHPAQAGQA